MDQKPDPKGTPATRVLKVDISNFGPISRGKFELRPFTILIGPNNSGKTYASMLVHTMFSAYEQAANYWLIPEFVEHQLLRPDFQDLTKKMSKFLRNIPLTGGQVKIPSTYINDVKKMAFKHTVEDYFPKNLQENFGLQLHDLVRIRAPSAKLKISSLDQITVSITQKAKIRYDFSDREHILRQNAGEPLSIWPAFLLDQKVVIARTKFDKTIDEIIKHLAAKIPSKLNHGTVALLSLILRLIHVPGMNFPRRSFYFPAARSGIMHAYKPILSNAVNSYKYANSSFNPATTGVVSDLLSSLINIDGENTNKIAKIGQNLENDLFDGVIFLRKTILGNPEIYYKFMNKDLPIHISSSSIAENTPLSLFLRHVVQTQDMLIIEEPEAHLHPTNQLKLVRFLVHLVRSGVQVFVTTHSLFFLEYLSTFVKLGNLTDKQRQSRNYDKRDYLLDSDVAPYVFKKKSTGNHVIEEIPHSAKEGISQEEFVRVSIDMYNKDVLLDHVLEGDNNGEN